MFSDFQPAARRSAHSAGRVVLLAGLVCLVVAGCGRRGPLEPPPGAKNLVEYPEDRETQAEADSNSQTFATNPTGKPAKASRKIIPPKRDFVLDPLL